MPITVVPSEQALQPVPANPSVPNPSAPPVRSARRAPRPALRLVSTRDMPRESWLDVRRRGIGSSDAASAVGLSPYQSQLELWMHKTGKADLLPPIDPNDETSPLYWGPCQKHHRHGSGSVISKALGGARGSALP